MPYIGQIPAAAALTASDITDGIITNAKLAQDIISAETALGATPADTDEFLVSDAGTLKRMDYSHIKAGGAWNKLVRKTVTTGDTIIEFDDSTASEWFSSDYTTYKLIISGLQINETSPTNKELHMLMSTGSSYATSNYAGSSWGFLEGATAWSTGVNGGTSDIRITYDNVGGNTGEQSNWEFTFEDPLGTDNYKAVRWDGVNIDHNGQARYDMGIAQLKTETALDGFKFYLESDFAFRDGTATLYGITY
jgi:hypothetical protein